MIVEVVRHAANQVIQAIILVGVVMLFIGIVVGLFFLDKFRWGGCP